MPGARAFRRRLAEAGASPQVSAALLREALAQVEDGNLDEPRAAA